MGIWWFNIGISYWFKTLLKTSSILLHTTGQLKSTYCTCCLMLCDCQQGLWGGLSSIVNKIMSIICPCSSTCTCAFGSLLRKIYAAALHTVNWMFWTGLGVGFGRRSVNHSYGTFWKSLDWFESSTPAVLKDTASNNYCYLWQHYYIYFNYHQSPFWISLNKLLCTRNYHYF